MDAEEVGIGDLDEIVDEIIDVFQDLVDVKNIDMKNDEPTNSLFPDKTLIYGSDYEVLVDGIRDVFLKYYIGG